MATKCWFECPECHEENDFNWDTFSFAGNFTFSARCKCGVESVIYVDVSAQQSVHPTCGESAPFQALSTDGENPAPEHLSTPPTSG